MGYTERNNQTNSDYEVKGKNLEEDRQAAEVSMTDANSL